MSNITTSRTWHDRPLWGIYLMLISVFVHVLGIVFEKKLLDIYQVPQMAFIRALLRLVPLFITLFRRNEIKAIFVVQQPISHVLRLVAYVSYSYCMLYALSVAPLAMIGSLQYITPFFTLALSAWFLRERIDLHKWIAIGITTGGVLIALRPGSGHLEVVSLLILFASFLGSINKIMIRKLTATEHSLAITVYGNLALVFVSIPAIMFKWHPLSWHDWGCFAIAGIFTSIAQFTSIQALRFAEASTLASLDCSSLVWGILFDFFLWQTIPTNHLILGAVIIVASNLYLVRSTRKV